MNNSMRFVGMTILLSASVMFAQNSAPPAPGSRQVPCWKQAGISRSVMEQRHDIERDTHSQIASVCEDSSLTAQQKQQKVKDIRQQALQKFDALITTEQRATLHTCQQQRSADRPVGEGRHPGAGPCGNMERPQEPQGQAPANGTPPAQNSQPQK